MHASARHCSRPGADQPQHCRRRSQLKEDALQPSNVRDVVRDRADMPRLELNNCKADECGLLKQRFEQFSSVVLRLELELLRDSRPTMEIDELWRQRWILIRAIVPFPAPTIKDARLKAAVVFSLVSNGELRIGLTPQCFEDYDRAITVSSKTETDLDPPSRNYRAHVERYEMRWRRPACNRPSLTTPRGGSSRPDCLR